VQLNLFYILRILKFDLVLGIGNWELGIGNWELIGFNFKVIY